MATGNRKCALVLAFEDAGVSTRKALGEILNCSLSSSNVLSRTHNEEAWIVREDPDLSRIVGNLGVVYGPDADIGDLGKGNKNMGILVNIWKALNNRQAQRQVTAEKQPQTHRLQSFRKKWWDL